MDLIVASGSAGLGFVIGALIGFYIDEADKLTLRVISGAISVIAGAGVIAIFRLLSSEHGITRENWFYGIGLPAGFILALIYNQISFGPYKDSK